MHAVTVTFERIFDLQRHEASKSCPKHTTFGFVSGGEPHYAVSVPAWPTFEVGITVTVLLRKEGNWQSLTGWVNHQSGEVITPNYQRSTFYALLSAALALFSWIGFMGASSSISATGGRFFAGTFISLFAAIFIILARQGCRQRRDAFSIRATTIPQSSNEIRK